MAVMEGASPVLAREAALRPRVRAVLDTRRFDGWVALCSTWMLIGLYLDGWAHNTLPSSIETFLTPWHAVLYSGFAAVALLLGGTYASNVMRGVHWRRALPKEYMLSLLGVIIFAWSAGADILWHALFGFEADVEALLSPSHLALLTGGVLIVGGPFRMAWRRGRTAAPEGWARLWPALVSLLCIFSACTFFTQYSNAFTHAADFVGREPARDRFIWDTAALSNVLVPAVLMMGAVLLAIRRWTLPAGSMTFLLFGNAVLMFVEGSSYSGGQWPVLAAALMGSVLADVLLAVLKPSAGRVGALRLFAFFVPFAFFLLYFAVLILSQGVWWRIHMWLGVPFLAGITGLGLSFLLVPPEIPAEAAAG